MTDDEFINLFRFPQKKERIESGKLCERCGGTDIEHTSAITPLFCCKDCNHVVLDLRGAEV